MTLTKAAPTDWAKWFAAVTGMPVEKVREKLEMGGLNDRLDTSKKDGPRLVTEGLTTTTVGSR